MHAPLSSADRRPCPLLVHIQRALLRPIGRLVLQKSYDDDALSPPFFHSRALLTLLPNCQPSQAQLLQRGGSSRTERNRQRIRTRRTTSVATATSFAAAHTSQQWAHVAVGSRRAAPAATPLLAHIQSLQHSAAGQATRQAA
jgi:hypothetical protein